MEISSVSSQKSWYASKKTKMSDSEKEKAQDILSQYDAENSSDTDLKSMMEEFRKSGIRPTDELKKMIADAGFKIPEPPKRTMENIDPRSILNNSGNSDSSTSDLSSLLKQFSNGEITESELQAKLAEATAKVLYGFSSNNSGSLIDIEA